MAAYRTVSIDGLDLFYREAGPADAPSLVLLPGFPASSAQYQALMDRLEGQLHLISPDYPGFGYSSTPATAEFAYTFDHLAELTERLLLEHVGLVSSWPYVALRVERGGAGDPVARRWMLRTRLWPHEDGGV